MNNPTTLRPRHRFAHAASTCALLLKIATATVVPHALFSSNAVLQRDQALPVWGQAADGENVTVEFAGHRVSTTAASGSWRVTLPALPANSSPQRMIIRGSNEIVLDNILIGDVWLCSGQSNMAWTLSKSANGAAVAAAVHEPQVRLLTVPRRQSDEPARDFKAQWQPCEPAHVAGFSAVGYFFGRDLQRTLQVPIGLIGSYVGGTAAELWTSASGMQTLPELRDLVTKHQQSVLAFDPARAAEAFSKAQAAYQQQVQKAKEQNRPAPRPPTLAASPKGRGPSSLYNGMIAPLQPFALRGVIWYQGESNRHNVPLYGKLFPQLIADWRRAWQQPALPFLFVQLAPFNEISPQLRDVQTQTWLRTASTGMAVITDHGSARDIHPQAKEPVGQRLALVARAVAYGEKITYSGPVIQRATATKSVVKLQFRFSDNGLTSQPSDASLRGFALAGADGKFVEARARIVGQTVEVEADLVRQPQRVRFGWSNVPDVNFFNRELLPAVPFEVAVTR